MERNDFVIELSGSDVDVVANHGVIPGSLVAGFQFFVNWDRVAEVLKLMAGEEVVLTKKNDTRMSLMRFDDDGFQLMH